MNFFEITNSNLLIEHISLISSNSTRLPLLYVFALGSYIFLYLLTVQYRFTSPMQRSFTIPVVNEKGYVLKQWRLFRLRPRSVSSIKMFDLRIVLPHLTLLVLIFLFIPVWIYTGPLLTFWFDHCRLSPLSFKMLLISFLISFVSLQRVEFAYLNSNALVRLIIMQTFVLMPMWFFWLYSSTNIYTFIFSIELLNILIFVMLCTSQLSYESVWIEKNRFSILIFFWMSTVSSVTLFSFLVLYSYIGFSLNWNLIYLSELWLVGSSSTCIKSSTILLGFFIFIVFLKSGLPPLFFWKSLLFSNTSLQFVALYTTLYYFPLFAYFILNIMTLLDYFSLMISTTLLISLVAPSMLVVTSIIVQKTYSLNTFMAFSSFATSSLIVFTVIVNTLSDFTFLNTQYSSSILYLTSYTLTLILLFSLVTKMNPLPSSTFASLIDYSSSLVERSVLRNWLLLILASMAGLPPLLSFVAKITLLSFINLINFSALLILFFSFLFLILIFYFQNSRFLLTQPSSNNLSSSNFSVTSSDNYLNFYISAKVQLTIAFIFLFGFVLYADSFILINWILS